MRETLKNQYHVYSLLYCGATSDVKRQVDSNDLSSVVMPLCYHSLTSGDVGGAFTMSYTIRRQVVGLNEMPCFCCWNDNIKTTIF